MPRGDIVILVPYVTHRHPDFWVDPEQFEPTRFLPASRTAINRWAYFPFGAGQRKCLGMDFALMEAQLTLAMIAQRYQFHSPDQLDVRPDPYVTLRPRAMCRCSCRHDDLLVSIPLVRALLLSRSDVELVSRAFSRTRCLRPLGVGDVASLESSSMRGSFDPNLEAIAAARPDLIVDAWAEGKPSTPG